MLSVFIKLFWGEGGKLWYVVNVYGLLLWSAVSYGLEELSALTIVCECVCKGESVCVFMCVFSWFRVFRDCVCMCDGWM
jgi:hypothetical protein